VTQQVSFISQVAVTCLILNKLACSFWTSL